MHSRLANYTAFFTLLFLLPLAAIANGSAKQLAAQMAERAGEQLLKWHKKNDLKSVFTGRKIKIMVLPCLRKNTSVTAAGDTTMLGNELSLMLVEALGDVAVGRQHISDLFILQLGTETPKMGFEFIYVRPDKEVDESRANNLLEAALQPDFVLKWNYTMNGEAAQLTGQFAILETVMHYANPFKDNNEIPLVSHPIVVNISPADKAELSEKDRGLFEIKVFKNLMENFYGSSLIPAPHIFTMKRCETCGVGFDTDSLIRSSIGVNQPYKVKIRNTNLSNYYVYLLIYEPLDPAKKHLYVIPFSGQQLEYVMQKGSQYFPSARRAIMLNLPNNSWNGGYQVLIKVFATPLPMLNYTQLMREKQGAGETFWLDEAKAAQFFRRLKNHNDPKRPIYTANITVFVDEEE